MNYKEKRTPRNISVQAKESGGIQAGGHVLKRADGIPVLLDLYPKAKFRPEVGVDKYAVTH